ncbi:MAG: hypothetical protein COA42_09505, partial [Alteromonadaceae bacterium]
MPNPADPNSPSMPDMAEILRKAEMQQMQLKLETQFRRNMEMFKTLSPEIYDEFNNYEPTELRLMYTPEGYLNLVNYNLNNKPVYSKDPKEFSREQVDAFVSGPSITSISIRKSDVYNESHIHVKLMNRLLDETKDYPKTATPSSKVPIGMMVLSGCGLGYQIEYMLEKLDIYHLVLFDPHKDSFYASLHALDWMPIMQHFCRRGHMLRLFVGVRPQDAMANLRLMTDKIGLHNIVHTYLYRHFSSKKEEEFVSLYKKEFHLNATGTGFFDDEQVGFAHTFHNLNNNVKLFKHDSSYINHPPALIVGNGPSLDEHIEFIRKHHPNTVIFSCGTALASLARKDIKPDFQVEMERNINIVDWIKLGTTEEFREDIALLCLNTAAPEAIKLFKQSCMARKPNDIGEPLIMDVGGDRSILALQLCNPTVTNAAAAFALSMGFKELYFVGVDLGTAPDGRHHSSLSLYSDVESKATGSKDENEADHSLFNYSAAKYKTKGNFVDEVYTNPYLDSSRVNLQLLIRYFSSSVGGVTCYNSNNGALIEGAETIKQEDINITHKMENRAEFIQTLKDRHFTETLRNNEDKITEKQIHKKYLKQFFNMRKTLTLPKNLDNINDLYQAMSEIYITIAKLEKDDKVAKLFLRG